MSVSWAAVREAVACGCFLDLKQVAKALCSSECPAQVAQDIKRVCPSHVRGLTMRAAYLCIADGNHAHAVKYMQILADLIGLEASEVAALLMHCAISHLRSIGKLCCLPMLSWLMLQASVTSRCSHLYWYASELDETVESLDLYYRLASACQLEHYPLEVIRRLIEDGNGKYAFALFSASGLPATQTYEQLCEQVRERVRRQGNYL